MRKESGTTSSSSRSRGSAHPPTSSLGATAFQLVDAVVELYLGSVVRPFVRVHETFYAALNVALRKALDDRASSIPPWFTANFVTYARTALVVPTLLLLAWGCNVAASLVVLSVDFGDFLDGVVARFWVDEKKKAPVTASSEQGTTKDGKVSPTNSVDDSFEVVTTGSPHSVPSWGNIQRHRTYGSFLDAVCDKCYIVPCWIVLLTTVQHSAALRPVQYGVLLWLIVAEVASACVRFQAYFTAPCVAPPIVEGYDFGTSAVKADHIGKAKQTFEMVGTALFVLPWLGRYLGLALLMLAVPLAYESVRRKVKRRVVYVVHDANAFDHRSIKFFHQAKGLGSRLVVGIPGAKRTDAVLNACAVSAVDEVVAEAPTRADLMFLERYGVDYVVSLPSQGKLVTDEVLADNRCLVISDDNVARPLLKPTKPAEHKE